MQLCTTFAAAVCSCIVNCAQFVGCLYFATKSVPGRRRPDRDDPQVVKERFFRVGVASFLAPFIMLLFNSFPGNGGSCTANERLVRWFGLWGTPIVPASFLPLALTMLLFLGPLLTNWLDRDSATKLTAQIQQRFQGERERLTLIRNLIVGPLAEEWVFRACMCERATLVATT